MGKVAESDVRYRVVEIIRDITHTKQKKIEDGDTLVSLGMDSLNMVYFGLDIDEEFGFEEELGGLHDLCEKEINRDYKAAQTVNSGFNHSTSLPTVENVLTVGRVVSYIGKRLEERG